MSTIHRLASLHMPDVRAFVAQSVPEHVHARPAPAPVDDERHREMAPGRGSDGALAGGYTRTLLKTVAVKGEGTQGKRVRLDALAHM